MFELHETVKQTVLTFLEILGIIEWTGNGVK